MSLAMAILLRREAFHLQAWTGPRRSSRDSIAGAGMTKRRERRGDDESPRNLGKIRDRLRRSADFGQHAEPVVADFGVVGVDEDFIEERINGRA